MSTKLYIIRDTLAGSPAGPLVVLEHDAVAIRMFREILSDKNSMVARFATDHELLCVGKFDRHTCNVLPEADQDIMGPRVIITGAALSAVIQAEEESKV